jgi:hypothetical protein
MMQSKMTEKEFVEKVTYPYGRGAIGVSPEVVQHVVVCAREAGLEFAPEPVPVPESLIYVGGELVPGSLDAAAGTGSIGCWAFPPEIHRAAALRLAATRYRAYPGLRAAAQDLLYRIHQNLAPLTQQYLRDEVSELAAELAKGPK